MVDPHGVEGLNIGEQVGTVRVAADHAAAVALDADDAAVLPVADFVLVGKLQLVQEILGHGLLLGSLLHVLDKAGPFSSFQLVQKRCF